MQKKSKAETAKRLTAGIVVVILLCICLTVTTAALAYAMVEVEDNVFVTGEVRINLNDGKPVIQDDEYLFEAGMTVKKPFFVKNESTCDVYYKLYFQNVSGGLADVLEITIFDGDRVLCAGTPRELNRTAVGAADDILRVNETRELQIAFHCPETVGNAAQQLHLNFDFAADAVQVKNNDNREFD